MNGSPKDPALNRRLRNVKHIILVLSGKGGVGKSSISVQLALSLLNRRQDAQVGLLDIDLTGPSIPRMLGLEGHSVLQSNDGWIPVHTNFDHASPPQDSSASGHHHKILKCMSIGFLLKDPKDSVVWRGPKKNAMIRQFLVDVSWGELDWLIIDTPPGTSDEHISLVEQLAPLLIHQSDPTLSNEPLPSLSSILVTTPQAVSLLDVSKEYDFTRKTGLKVLGLIENMSGYLCPHCHQVQNLFGSGGGFNFCKKISTQSNIDLNNNNNNNNNNNISLTQQQQRELKFLGAIPIDVEFMKLMDQAMNSDLLLSSQKTPSPINPSSPTSLISNSQLIKRYSQTKSCQIFSEICEQIVEAVTSLQ